MICKEKRQMKFTSLLLVSLSILLTGCANPHRLGTHVAQLRMQQTYNTSATLNNLEVIPSGNGERMEDAYSAYTGKSGETLEGGSSSQVLLGFN
jgi:uncharacterized lipoprotein YajG